MATSIPEIDVDAADLASPRAPEIAHALDDAFRRTDYVLERLDRNYAYRQAGP